jgi:hypothetical protein
MDADGIIQVEFKGAGRHGHVAQTQHVALDGLDRVSLIKRLQGRVRLREVCARHGVPEDKFTLSSGPGHGQRVVHRVRDATRDFLAPREVAPPVHSLFRRLPVNQVRREIARRSALRQYEERRPMPPALSFQG